MREQSKDGCDDATLRMIAAEAVDAVNSRRQVRSFAVRHPTFAPDDAYRVTAFANTTRRAQGFSPVGRKIGFTNRTIWPEYNVFAPNWAYVYDRTLHDLAQPLLLAPYSEPKIEPEIIFGLSSTPALGMND